MTIDEKYMRMALKLAWHGIGNVEPNPAVGCVIVKNNKIIGRGWHKKFGGLHAEINALKNCKKSPHGATMYVTLEPCCHYGKTPPCTKAITRAGIKKVVAATRDPTKEINGKGLKILEKAGIEVKTHICKSEAEKLNAPFFKFARTEKPWVIVKWAQSKDGFLARSDKKRWITNAKSRKDSHKLRKKVQAILVGVNTVLDDDPMLTARPAIGRQPIRVVLDSRLRIPVDCNLVKTALKSPLLIFTALRNDKKILLLKKKGVEIATVDSVNGKCSLKSVLANLGQRGIEQMLVEGGKEVITSFLTQKRADEIIIYTSNGRLAKRGMVKASREMKEAYRYVKNCCEKKRFDTDLCLRGFVKR